MPFRFLAFLILIAKCLSNCMNSERTQHYCLFMACNGFKISTFMYKNEDIYT